MRHFWKTPSPSAIAAACLMLISGANAQMPPMIPGMPPGFSPAASSPEEGAGVAGVVAAPDAQGDTAEVATKRDPFWPVGYAPKRQKKTKEGGTGKPSMTVESTPDPVRVPLWDEARKKVDIRGISLIHDKNSKTPKYLAMVAGKLVEVGNVVTVKYEDRVYRWRVVGISEEGVSLRNLDVRSE